MCKLVTGLLNNKCKLFSGRDRPVYAFTLCLNVNNKEIMTAVNSIFFDFIIFVFIILNN